MPSTDSDAAKELMKRETVVSQITAMPHGPQRQRFMALRQQVTDQWLTPSKPAQDTPGTPTWRHRHGRHRAPMTKDIRPVGFTGTRHGLTMAQQLTLQGSCSTQWLGPGTTLHHGGARGADRQAADLALAIGYVTTAHPPAGHEPEDYLLRNCAIVDACDELIAAPGGMREERRSGTWATVRYARKVGRMTTIIWPDGTTSLETGDIRL